MLEPRLPLHRSPPLRRDRFGHRKKRLLCLAFSALASGGAARAQGTLATADGLRLTLGSAGTVSSLQSNSLEYASASIPSGFYYREVPATAPNAAPNPSFELGGSSPSSWSWANNSAGSWSWDSTTAALGARSLRVAIPGTVSKPGPLVSSAVFPILKNTTYNLSCQMKASSLSYPLTLFIMEQGFDGSIVQRPLSGPTGTTGWRSQSITFTTSPLAVSAYFKAQIYNGHGTAWLDDVRLEDVFGNRQPTAFGGAVTGSGGVLTQTASTNGLSLNARFTAAASAIRVDVTVSDSTGQDRAIEVAFRLPIDAGGWRWENSFVSSTPIARGVRYENVDAGFNRQLRSLYPFATIKNGATAFSLAVPMGPQMQRFSYDTKYGFRSTWDLGISAAATKTRAKAVWTFWIYSSSKSWGLRGAAEKYYALNAGSFSSPLKLKGAWVLPSTGASLSDVPQFQDFGWGIVEGNSENAVANQNGILVHRYIDPVIWYRQFSGYSAQPSYSVLVSALQNDSTHGTGTTVDETPVNEMATAVLNSSPLDSGSRYQITGSPYFWYRNTLQAYPASPDPDIPAPSMWSVLKKYGVDEPVATALGNGDHLDGIFLDNLTPAFASIENYRRSLWAYSDFPLTFSYRTRKVIQYHGFATSEFCRGMKSYLNGKGMTLWGSSAARDFNWVAPWLDIMGGEVEGAEAADTAYLRRALSFGKNWTNLYVPDGSAPNATQVLAYLRQALLLGFYPGMNGTYWSSRLSYERDRATFRKYVPLIKKAISAGWRPVPYAVPSDPGIYVERFDSQTSNVLYLAAQNSGTATKTFQLTLDGAALQIGAGTVTVKELVGATAMSPARSGSNVLFTDVLTPGETALYEITDSGAASPAPLPPAGSGIANGGFESGTGSPTAWTLGAGLSNGQWTWDVATFVSGRRSVKLDVPGVLDLSSPVLQSAAFSLSPNRTYTFSAWMKAYSVGGRVPPIVWLVELDSSGQLLKSSAGAAIQHGLKGPQGTGSWSQYSVSFETDPRCARAYVYASLYAGHGVLWLDDVELK